MKLGAGRVACAIAAAFATTLAAGEARAVDDAGLTYWTYETEHFRVTYPAPLEQVAARIATLAESIHDRISPQMQFAPGAKTEVLVTDDTDGANGSASPVPYNAIKLFATAPDDVSTLSDYDDWYLGLVTHEYTHILHTGNISGLASVANVVIGRTLSPNSAQPRWLIEGLAVVFESEYTAGGRIRSTLFDTWLRADVLEDNVARLDQISSGAERWPYGNLFYLYGSRFLRWITDVYGPNTMPAVSADYGATTIPFGINRAIRRVTGRTYEDLYDAWVTHLKRHYKAQVAKVDAKGRREGVRITHGGRDAGYPRFIPPELRKDPKANEIFYYRDDADHTAGLYRLAVGDPTKKGERDVDLEIRTSTDAFPAFTPEGDILFNDRAPFKNLYSRHDLFVVPRGKSSTEGTEIYRKRLTTGLRSTYPDVSPNGRNVVFCVNDHGTTTLTIADRDAEGKLSHVRPLVATKAFDQAYTPRFSPDGKRVAWSAWRAGGYRDIRVVDLESGAVTDVTHDRSLDLHPTWSSDGKSIYFSSDRSGIFNVYVRELASGRERMVTNVVGAALAPAISPDGTTLVYVGYTHEGYDVFAMKLDPDRFLDADAPPEDRPEPYDQPKKVKLTKSKYNPLRTFRPQNYFLDIAPGNYSSTAVTVTASAGDLVGHHGLDAAVGFDPGAPEPRIDLAYAYAGLPVNLSAGFSRQVLPRTKGFRVNGVETPFDETLTSFSTSAAVPILGSFVSQSVSLSYTATLYHGDLQLPAPLDPMEPITKKPDEGFLSQFKLGYSLNATHGSSDVAGGTRSGFAMSVGLTLGDHAIGSDRSLYQIEANAAAYIPMPWPGHQTIATRASMGVAAGERAGNNFFIGGYDLEHNGPIDTLFSGVYDGAFVLRGYGAGSYAGSEYFLATIEYRAPIVKPNWGPSSLPIFLRRIDASAFADWGGAFNDFEFQRLRFFFQDRLLYSPQLHPSVGGEVWLALTLGNRVDSSLRLGYAYGFDEGAIDNGQFYFLSTSAF